MSDVNAPLYSLNAGQVSRLALGRLDLAKMRMAMELQENLLPKALGPATMRPGTAMQSRTRNDAFARLLPFVSNTYTTAELELTANFMRVLVSGTAISRVAVTSTVANGDFATDVASWTSADEPGAVSVWSSSFSGSLSLQGTGFNAAIRRQTVTTSSAGVEHALRVVVSRGPVTFMVGSALGLDDYVSRTDLRTGEHSLAFTPSGSYYIDVRSTAESPKYVASIKVEAAGIVEVATPWPEAALRGIRYDQSGDVLFCACLGYQQQRIERRSQRSWSVANYSVDDGPFRFINTTSTEIAANATRNTATLTATAPVFRAGHVGAIFRLDVAGQGYTNELGAANQFTDPIRVSGVSTSRTFTFTISGTWTGTITLQRSVGTVGAWTDSGTYAVNGGPTSINDGLDNQIVYYRIGFKPGGYTSGVATVNIAYAGGEQSGIVRVTGFTSPTSVDVDVLEQLPSTATTRNWAEGAWSPTRGWPSAVCLYDGRLWFAKTDMLYGSVSDAFESFDATKEGDSGPISRSIATGGFDSIHWLLPLQRLLAGTSGQEVSIRSSSFDEPLTPTQFTARAASTRGSAEVGAVKVDSGGIYVQRNGIRIMEMRYDVNAQDYQSLDLTRLNDEICLAGAVELGVQREPETRIWSILGDGKCAVLTYERADEVVAWTPATFPGGIVESMCVTPRAGGDRVSFVIKRTVSGSDRRYIETLALQSECLGNAALSKNLDCHIVYDGAPTTTITGLGHLEGKQVAVWGDGKPTVSGRSPLTVTSGSITLPYAVSKAVVGIPYFWRLKSTKLGAGGQGSTNLLQPKRVEKVGILAADLGWKGVKFGSDFTTMRELPNTYQSKPLAADYVFPAYDGDLSAGSGGWDNDSRLCMEGVSPYPATLEAIVIGMSANQRGQGAPRQAGNQG